MARLRLRFARGEEIKFISHLDLVRLWERALRRAGVPLAYSQGFSPHPQISLALPLSVGVTSEAELMDIYCMRSVTPYWLSDALGQQLPPGIGILEAYQVNPALPSLQSLIRFAEYRVTLDTAPGRDEIEDTIARLMALEHLPWQHQRDTGTKSYDIRALISSICLADWQPGCSLIDMKLRAGAGGAGRPEQVSFALGFQRPAAIHRTNLLLEAVNSR